MKLANQIGRRPRAKRDRHRANARPVWRRSPGIAAIAVLTMMLGGARAAGQSQGPTEYQLKAAFLFNFAKFVDWPASSFPNAEAPFSICILGEDPFGPVIDETLHGQSIDGRGVSVQRIRDAARLRGCQVAFISASEKSQLQEILQSVRGANVLLVGETAGFAEAGGTIQFRMEHNRVRFSINPEAAERAGLRISSKLLSLATIVHDGIGRGRS